MAKKEFQNGDYVKLNVLGLMGRNDEMKRWKGLVEETLYFPMKVGGTMIEINKRVRVNWGIRAEGKDSFIWTEKEEDLVRA